MMQFYAHSAEKKDKSDWQLLKAHLQGAAELAEKSGAKTGLGSVARLAALLHDLGKYNPKFQKRLEDDSIRVEHSAAGAKIIAEAAENAKPMQRLCARIIEYCILGHHAGLPDYADSEASLETRLKRFDKTELDSVWEKEINFSLEALKLPPKLVEELNASVYKGVDFSFIIRMVFSCLIDADRRNTQEFCEQKERESYRPLAEHLPDFLQKYNCHMEALRKKSARADMPQSRNLNRLRNEILDKVRGKAALPKGFYTLTVPTGGGKTLASLGFALDHAKAHGLERIIYTLPFTSIIDQTATLFKSLLGEEAVLEHHSNFSLPDEGKKQNEEQQKARDRLKVAMEDWGAPLIVTTNVQFFESLYSAKASAVRKIKNIANSIIILDEAQTIPLPLLAPCARALDTLVRLFGCTVVFCTATQPALDEGHMKEERAIAALPLAKGPEQELAPNPQDLAKELRRTTIKFAGETDFIGEMDNAALAEALAQERQGLIIVNSRRHAYELYSQAKKAGLEGLIHLTTRQCAAHRKQIIADIRSRLPKGEPCRVIATSLVEAGVDFDFPRVWRAEAGLDSVLQAAGRCNREGKRPREQSIVTVFKAEAVYKAPYEVRRQAENLEKILPRHKADLHSPQAIKDYFKITYWQHGEELDHEKIIREDLEDKICALKYPFRKIGEKFQMIKSGMEPIIIPPEGAQQWIDKMRIEEFSSGYLARKLQPYIVQVPPKARQKLIANGHVCFAAEHLRGNQFAVLHSVSLYNKERGLLWEEADYLTQEQYYF